VKGVAVNPVPVLGRLSRTVKEKKARPTMAWPFGGNSPMESTGCSIYFPVGAGAGVTTSLCCCAQAPSPNAATRTATITIIFRNFNLSRLLSSQVAPACLGRETRRSNAFLHFFEPLQTGRPVYFAYPVVPAPVVTTSFFCCAQAPSPKAVTSKATTVITFTNFNLYRLLSPQVALPL